MSSSASVAAASGGAIATIPPDPIKPEDIKASRPNPPDPAFTSRGLEVALNPQPLPPSPADGSKEVALNPQPLPPSPGDGPKEVALNPQPLPPLEAPHSPCPRLGMRR